MDIIWYVEDGYVNSGRPKIFTIEDEKLEGLTREEKRKYITDCIQDDFENSVSWACDIDKYLGES